MSQGTARRAGARRLRTVGCVLALAAGLVLTGGVASSDDATPPGGTVAWSVTPVLDPAGGARANFTHTLEPGRQVTDAAIVSNPGSVPLTVRVYAADAFVTPDGGIDLRTQEAGPEGLGAWVEVDAAEVTVPPGEQRRVEYTLTVPVRAVPGDHAGALVTSLVQEVASGGAVAVDMRYATRITVRVAGELDPALAVDGLAVDYRPAFWPWQPSAVHVTYEARNTGNTRLTARQALAAGGETVLLDDVPELLPGSDLALGSEVASSSWWPRAGVRLSLAPQVVPLPGTDPVPVPAVEVRAAGWAVPPGSALLVVVVGAGAWWLVSRARRRGVLGRPGRHSGGPADAPRDGEPDRSGRATVRSERHGASRAR